MAYATFDDTDIYLYRSVEGYFECINCKFMPEINLDLKDSFIGGAEATLLHLKRHEDAGHSTGGAIPRLRKEIERKYGSSIPE